MTKTLAFLLSASLAACAGRADYSATATMPSMVALGPGSDVQVVADSNEPVFYTDNTFWLYRDNTWFRSHDYRGGWARVDVVPEKLRRIDRPMAYVRYHGQGNVNASANAYNQSTPPSDDIDRRIQLQNDPRNQTPTDQTSPGTREPNPQGPTQPYPNPLPPNQVPPTPDSNANPNTEPNRTPDVPRMHMRNDATDTSEDRDRNIAPDTARDKNHDATTDRDQKTDDKDKDDKNPSDSK